MTTETPNSVLRVLIVEDQEIAAEAHEIFVNRCPGFRVSGVARSGSEAIRSLRTQRTDIVLLDMNLPDMTGIQLCRSMRAAGLTTDVIAVTAVRDIAVVREAISLGIVQYIIKPFTFATFSEKMRTYRDYANLLPTIPEIDQYHVDASLGLLRQGPSRSAIPKNINADTLHLVRILLRSASDELSGISAVELANAGGLSRATARRYLEYLADSGSATRQPRYGGLGRPEVEYRFTGKPGARPKT